MSSPSNPAETRAYILERLVGDTGEPDHIVAAARALGERAVPAVLDLLSQSFPSTFGVELKSAEVTRFSAARPEDATGWAMTIASSTTSPDAMVFLLDGEAIAVIVSSVFGGDPDMPIAPVTRALSPTEVDVATAVFEAAANVLNGSGERAFNLRLPLGQAITGPNIKKHVLRDGPAVRIDFSIFTGGGRGTLSVFLPQRVFLKHRGDAVAASADQAGEWRQRFNDEVMRSAVAIEARMPLTQLTLGQIASLHKGQVLELDEGAQSAASLSARGKTLFVCEFGKLGQNYTVRVRHPFDAGQDLIDTLATG